MIKREIISIGVSAALFCYTGYLILPVMDPSFRYQPTWSGKIIDYSPVNFITYTKPLVIKDWSLTPLVDINQTGRILGISRYHFDSLSSLSPYDITIGWGPMSDPDILRKIVIWQDDRSYFIRTNNPDIDWNSLSGYIKHIHVIPENNKVWEYVFNLNANDKIKIQGTLVNAQYKGDPVITTSTSYENKDANLSQMFLVHKIEKLDK